MDCLPLEDICRIDNAMTEIQVKASIYHEMGDSTFIGTFNERDYYYTKINGRPTIVIETPDAEAYETPDLLPPL